MDLLNAIYIRLYAKMLLIIPAPMMPMNTYLINLLLPLFATGLALITIFLLNKISPLNLPRFRYTCIDGLRGYLAFFVFLHHSYIWHSYIHTGEWRQPNSHLYRYFGSGSVMLFFMITSFLFFGKLLDAKKEGGSVDWLFLYSSRIMRISPLFLFASSVAFIVAGFAYDWNFNIESGEFLIKILLTLGMGLFSAPIVDSFTSNGIGGPVMAGVLWTLPYEWVFYFSLPALAFALRLKFSSYILLIPVIAICYLIIHKLDRMPANAFLSGALVAALVRTDFKNIVRGWFSTMLALSLIIFSVFRFEDPFSGYPLLIFTFFFSLVASGNSIFGILNSNISRTMGEISFGIYLLHGIFLFILVRILIGNTFLGGLTEENYWLFVLLCSPILIITCYFVFMKIEKPCLRKSNWLAKKIRLFFTNAMCSVNRS